MGKFLTWLKQMCCCDSSEPIRFKARCASACCKGEVVQVQMPMRQRAYTI